MNYSNEDFPESLREVMQSIDDIFSGEPITASAFIAMLYAYDQWKQHEKLLENK